MARERVYASPADKQRAYREREQILMGVVDAFIETVITAADEAGMPRLVDGLDPRDRTEWLREFTKRIDGRALVLFKRKPKP